MYQLIREEHTVSIHCLKVSQIFIIIFSWLEDKKESGTENCSSLYTFASSLCNLLSG